MPHDKIEDRFKDVASIDLIGDLWRRRLDTLISGIANADLYYLQIANAADHIRAEHQGRFLIELIQNANDQAVRQGLTNSFVSITRTEHLIAVGNSGQPFDSPKIDSITSIFKSDKPADICIGNKGIGFKAVFQVADSAEIYSTKVGGDLSGGCAIAFRMVRQPFENPAFLAEICALTNVLLTRDLKRRHAIETLFPNQDAMDVVLREAARAAGFTFPLRATVDDLQRRVQQLGISDTTLAATQTLIVLPVAAAGMSSERISQALDEICGDYGQASNIPAASSFLFLPGIAHINVVDHVRGFCVDLERADIDQSERLADGVVLCRQRMTSKRKELDPSAKRVSQASQDWWVAERIVGDRNQQDEEKGTRERQALRDAIETLQLPKENWKDVEHIPVAIALPIPITKDGINHIGRPLGPNGRFCIGLPTKVQTGVPLWVNAHFHGKIDRTAIEFGNEYNTLLFKVAVELSETLLEYLKIRSDGSERRLVTLAMERGTGELANAFYSHDGLARKSIVLAADGEFIEARKLRMPKAQDLSMFNVLVEGIGDINTYGFCLPDATLLADARCVLDEIAEDTEVADRLYMQRTDNQPSLLEHAAQRNRASGKDYWESYLGWILSRFDYVYSDQLKEQAILPTGNAELSKSSSRVFFTPVIVATRGTEETERTHSVDDAGDELAAIDENVGRLLRFFDDSAITVRTGTARDYTVLAQKLAPTNVGGLVRRPSQADIIRDALIPALDECRADTGKMLALLRQALLWLVAMSPKSRKRISTDELLVPVRGEGDSWAWVGPDRAYLGEGWVDDDPNIELLTRAYGDRPESQLVPWNRFERKASQLFGSADRNWWVQQMRGIGVWDCSRVIRAERRLEVMETWSYLHLTVKEGVRSQVPCPNDIWSKYLSAISQRRVQTKTGQDYYLRDVAWIDGLEEETIRPVVVEAMLRRPARYKRYQSTTLSRFSGEDSTDVPSLWVHAMRSEDWSAIPTTHGLRSPSTAWYLGPESRSIKADRFAFLPCVKPEFSTARELLYDLGVVTLEDAYIPRLVNALHELAEQKESVEPETQRHFSALVHDLYEAIQVKLKKQESPDSLKCLLDHPVPLIRGEQIEFIKLNDVDQLYVDDDPFRRRFIDGFDNAWVIPKRSHQTYNDLIQSLRGILGTDRVLRVSECPINIGFVPLETGVFVLSYLQQEYSSRSLAEEIALLIVKGGTQTTSPHEEMFRQTWSRIGRTRVIRGSFNHASRIHSCFDAQYVEGPALLVASILEPYEIIGALWQVVGPSYRDIWEAYAQALKVGMTSAFFEDRGVSPADRTEVETAIGLGFEQMLRRYQPICLALWRKRNASRPIDDFHVEWMKQARTLESVQTWLDWPNVQAAIELAHHEGEPAGSLSLLAELQLTVHEWQHARRELGTQPFKFDSTKRRYELSQSAVAGHIMAWFAYLVVPRASGAYGPTLSSKHADSVLAWVKQVRELNVPDDLVEEPLDHNIVTRRVALNTLQIAEALSIAQELSVIKEPILELSKAAPTEITAIKFKNEPDKAATIYEINDQATREQQAVVAVESVLKVADALTLKHGETLDLNLVRQQPLVELLSNGPWANRISVLAAIRYALEIFTPNTASRMKDRQAFRDQDDWRTLWQKFEELGEIPKSVTPVPPPPKFEILGSGWTEEEFVSSAAQGPSGELVQYLEECVDSSLDLAALLKIEREKLVTRDKKRRSGGGGSRKRTPEALLKMLGAVGEHFFFQQMKVLFKDFDVTNWKSKAKELFGYGDGDDSLGYDFEYHDMNGTLTGNNLVPRCLIEVKSTAQERADVFEMSTNEWETAIRCHDRRESAVYVIIRVVRTASRPQIADILVDPIQLHLDGVLNYSSRDLLVVVGKARKSN